MINSTNTINVDGTVIDQDEILKTLKLDESDKFTRWVLRPLAVLTALGIGAAVLISSAFMIMLTLAMLPLMAVAMWVAKTKIERDIAASDPVIDTQQ